MRTRRMPADAREGSRADFLARVAKEAAGAALRPGPARDRHLARLFGYATDTRTLIAAAGHVARGGPAAGADGVSPRELDGRAAVELARALSRAMRDGTYRPGPVRRKAIPKAGGGTRTLSLPTVIDRVAQTAVLLAVQPFADALLLPTTLGGRPGSSTARAIATAESLAAAGERWVWVTADIARAFDAVPQQKLMAALVAMLGDTPMAKLIGTMVNTESGVGIPQGGPLSPLLLNVLLDAELDRPWAERHPDVPLVRWVDDLLILTQNRREAEEVLDDLKAMLATTGMPLKNEPPRKAPVTADIGRDETTEWLRYRLGTEQGRLRVAIAKKAWANLKTHLRDAHQDDQPAAKAYAAVIGWAAYLGPCYASTDVTTAYERITETAGGLGLKEIPSREEVTNVWGTAYLWYAAERREVREQYEAVYPHGGRTAPMAIRDDAREGREGGSATAPPVRQKANAVPDAGETADPPPSTPFEAAATHTPAPAGLPPRDRHRRLAAPPRPRRRVAADVARRAARRRPRRHRVSGLRFGAEAHRTVRDPARLARPPPGRTDRALNDTAWLRADAPRPRPVIPQPRTAA